MCQVQCSLSVTCSVVSLIAIFLYCCAPDADHGTAEKHNYLTHQKPAMLHHVPIFASLEWCSLLLLWHECMIKFRLSLASVDYVPQRVKKA